MKKNVKKKWPRRAGSCYGGSVPAEPVEDLSNVHDPEVSSLMTVVAQGAARTQKTINVTSVVSG